MPPIAASVERSINFRIEHQCPQCGAPATIEETDRLFTCEYCRVSSYLMPKDVFRYLLPSKAPAEENVFYFPYWRMKGMVFSCVEEEIMHRYVDFSCRAAAAEAFPASVGLRSQALRLKFMSAENTARFVKPSLSVTRVLQLFDSRMDMEISEPVQYRRMVGESLSLVYSPFYVKDRLVDAVVNQPLTGEPAAPLPERQFDDNALDWNLHFLPTLCPHCGWNLEGEKDAVVLVCRNCSSAWMPTTKGFEKLKAAHIPLDEQNVLFLPFWRIRADVNGVALNSYEDLIRTANLPKVPQPGWDKQQFYFWVTAFKVRPGRFLRLATNLTIAQPRNELTFSLPSKRMFSPNLPLRDAVGSTKLSLANFITPKRIFYPKLNDIAISPKSYLLVWVPFIERNQEYVHPQYQISVLKSHLNLAKSL